MMNRLYTAGELSRILKVSKDTVWRWGRNGELKTVRAGRTVRFVLPSEERRSEDTKGKDT